MQQRPAFAAVAALILNLVVACDSPSGPSEIGEGAHSESGSESGVESSGRRAMSWARWAHSESGPESGSESSGHRTMSRARRAHSESGSESGSEPGESGMQYGLTDTARESRSGVDLVMQYNAGQARFSGTVTNTTNGAVSNVRVEVHLSNGIELGPTPRVDLAPGQVHQVELAPGSGSFTSWSVHVELGSLAS